VNEADSVEMPLATGEMSLHHIRLVHCSRPNRSSQRRIGFAIRYIPTRLHQTTGERQCATLVRGVDRYNHFEHEPRPAHDLAPDAVEFLTNLIDRRRRLLLRGTQKAEG
jgi:ectoine hydroxylase-related dioxygenase (phytanoyl-CoA dioxygenase family)